MVLTHARPWRHPKTGTYWFRRRVAKELSLLVAGSEQRKSLQTTEPVFARMRYFLAAAHIDVVGVEVSLCPRRGPGVAGRRKAAAAMRQPIQRLRHHRARPLLMARSCRHRGSTRGPPTRDGQGCPPSGDTDCRASPGSSRSRDGQRASVPRASARACRPRRGWGIWAAATGRRLPLADMSRYRPGA